MVILWREWVRNFFRGWDVERSSARFSRVLWAKVGEGAVSWCRHGRHLLSVQRLGWYAHIVSWLPLWSLFILLSQVWLPFVSLERVVISIRGNGFKFLRWLCSKKVERV